jgi:hypothetical protein
MDHTDGAKDFDFFIGDWSVHHRRLRRRLAGDGQWDEFAGTTTVRKVLAGLGNFDEGPIALPGDPYVGATLRLFNPKSGLWSIYWMDSRNPGLDPPMTGRFQEGRGLFQGDDTFEGRPIRVRFVWTPQDARSCRWEQAFSADQGASWETNWHMAFTRA